MPTYLVLTSRQGTFIYLILASASYLKFPFSTPEVTNGIGMSLWILYTLTQGGTNAKSFATIYTKASG